MREHVNDPSRKSPYDLSSLDGKPEIKLPLVRQSLQRMADEAEKGENYYPGIDPQIHPPKDEYLKALKLDSGAMFIGYYKPSSGEWFVNAFGCSYTQLPEEHKVVLYWNLDKSLRP